MGNGPIGLWFRADNNNKIIVIAIVMSFLFAFGSTFVTVCVCVCFCLRQTSNCHRLIVISIKVVSMHNI